MNSTDQKYLPVFHLLIAIFISSSAFAGGVDELHILKISDQDQRVVIKMPDGKMQIIAVGDKIGDQGKVVEIVKDRIVIEEKKNQDMEKIIIRLENGKQRIERVKKRTEQMPQLYAPGTSTKKNDNQTVRSGSSIE